MDGKALCPTAMNRKTEYGRQHRPGVRLAAIAGLVGLVVYLAQASFLSSNSQVVSIPIHSEHIIATCRSLHDTPHPPEDFGRRQVSDRFVPGTKPVLLRNARIWTGEKNGTEVFYGSIFIENGLIRAIGRAHQSDSIHPPYKDLEVYDLKGAWVTPGIVDAHSHVGDGSSPDLEGARDDNSLKGPTQPWLRSLDGLNTHDLSYSLSVAGGVTTANVLPGSANAIGGQAFTIKLRPTTERTPTAMLLEPAFNINGSTPNGPLRWRQLKQACGENVSREYGFTRMDTFWAFRKIYNEARKIKESQDDYCERALAGQWNGLGDFPSSLQYEALVDVLRGRVKIHTHCYEAVDFDGLIRLSQEFKIPIAAVHHAHEAYLVPDLLKSAYDHTPAAAIFALNSRYKREAYRGSEFAARVLNENGIKVIMKSDHPVMNERDLLYEAQQAFFYGLPENVAIAAVTSTPADVLGYGHRIGYIRKGYDADLVVWDSHPLSLGATPKQVFIDGIAQLKDSFVTKKPSAFQDTPRVPNFDNEARRAVEYEGTPPILPKPAKRTVFFKNVTSLILPGVGGDINAVRMPGTVVVQDGQIMCHGRDETCAAHYLGVDEIDVVDLQGGAVQPALSTYGAPLGVVEIDQEASTQDGIIFDPLIVNTPKILGGAIPRAADGLAFQGRDALYAYRFGVTTAFSAPRHYGFLGGLSVAFNTGAAHRLAPGAVIQDIAALHVKVDLSSAVSVSTQIAALRHLLLDGGDGELGAAFKAASKGKLTLVVEVESADVIATLISVKQAVENQVGSRMKLTIAGGTEAHLLADELAAAHIGVVLVPFRSFPWEWQQRRILPGPPLTEVSAVTKLVQAGVVTAIGVREAWDARNMAIYVAWAAIEAGGRLTKQQAIALGTTNVQKLLGAKVHATDMDLVATRGGALFNSPMEAKVVGVISPKRQLVDLF